MSISNEHDLRYKLGEETHRIIKYDLLPHLKRLDSVADFTRSAIRGQVKELHEQAAGGRVAERLILLLTNIRRIEEKAPDSAVKATIKEERCGKSLTVSISNRDAEWFGKFTDETTLGTSKAVRCCIFGELANIAERTTILDRWQSNEIIRTWMELKASLGESIHHLHSTLAKWFVRNQRYISHFIQRDPQPFMDFAESYKNDFHQSELYEDIIELYGDHVLTNVENLIEEYSDIHLSKNDDAEWLVDAIPE